MNIDLISFIRQIVTSSIMYTCVKNTHKNLCIIYIVYWWCCPLHAEQRPFGFSLRIKGPVVISRDSSFQNTPLGWQKGHNVDGRWPWIKNTVRVTRFFVVTRESTCLFIQGEHQHSGQKYMWRCGEKTTIHVAFSLFILSKYWEKPAVI